MTAHEEAEAAAARAGVEIRLLEPAEVAAAADLLASIWGTATVEPPLMIALRHSGAYVAGAFDSRQAPSGQSGRMLGACIGYFAQPLGQTLHSHVAGVAPGTERRGIGMAMKLHQRAWAHDLGLSAITWTFDPLVSRNAAFNLSRLGVDVAEYLVDFYGDMSDGVNAGQGSDRLLVRWAVDSDSGGPRPDAGTRVATGGATHGDPMRELAEADPDLTGTTLSNPTTASAATTAQSATTAPAPTSASALRADGDGEPRPVVPDPTADVLTIAVPPDIEALRATNAPQAARWRGAVRGAMVPLLDRGWRVTGFHDHHYLLGRP
ncbi:hypothetical protein [Demequina sp. NBRC 110056]|uniref:hypothetical protein n=1 Tax=Demequina sp. NBRC 110056 TaxID=1570345 RepID=UPI000A0081D6|nr:hypothetical protein [Demequina sp. NBRC 110056]